MIRRVLCIDGGGIKGIFPAAFLASIEQATSTRISENFDLVVGTSTGGIIALGLGLGMSSAEILAFYREAGPNIFRTFPLLHAVRHLFATKYGTDALRDALEARFGDRRLGDSRLRLVIPAQNLETGEVHIFKTAHHERFVMDHREKALDVALATTAAPTYFPTHWLYGSPLVDGGTWANNPIGVATVEATAVLGWPTSDIRVLSVGCTTAPLDVGILRRWPLGRLLWAPKIADVMMAGQASAAAGTAKLILGSERILRVSSVVAPKRFLLDSAGEIEALEGLGRGEARQHVDRIARDFLFAPADRFVPMNA